jgi:aldehyde:ferredoxin oxidoreductase
MGATIAVAMEAGIADFGDAEAAIKLIKEVGEGTPMGRILGSGAYVTGQVLGVERVPVVKKQAMPAYDPRAVQGIGVTYATTTMGADHTAGYAVATNIMKVGGDVDPLKPEGQVALSRDLQVTTAAVDSTGMCLFIAFAVMDQADTFQALLDLISGFSGSPLTAEDVAELGKSVLRNERDFNLRAGMTNKDDRLPDYMLKEKLAPHNIVFEVTDDDLDQVHNF